jgi:hypothetical protein
MEAARREAKRLAGLSRGMTRARVIGFLGLALVWLRYSKVS